MSQNQQPEPRPLLQNPFDRLSETKASDKEDVGRNSVYREAYLTRKKKLIVPTGV